MSSDKENNLTIVDNWFTEVFFSKKIICLGLVQDQNLIHIYPNVYHLDLVSFVWSFSFEE